MSQIYGDYRFKVTTSGHNLLAALMATGKGLEITRVAVGSGRVEADRELADMTDLVEYVADAAIAAREHDGDELHLTVQYASNMTPGLGMFYLSEFVVEAKHPVTGESVNLLYATLGDYIQPVRAYSEVTAPDVRNYPLTIIVSSDIEVTVSAAGGLVTYDELNDAVDTAVKEATKDVGGIVKTIFFSLAPEDWKDAGGGTYPLYADIENEDIAKSQVPQVVFDEDSLDAAAVARICKTQQSYAGYVRMKAKTVPAEELSGVLYMIGKATGGGGGGGDYELPTATRTRLGGVMIGDGLNYRADGTTYVDKDAVAEDVTPKVVEDATAPEADVDAMLNEVFGPEKAANAEGDGL